MSYLSTAPHSRHAPDVHSRHAALAPCKPQCAQHDWRGHRGVPAGGTREPQNSVIRDMPDGNTQLLALAKPDGPLRGQHLTYGQVWFAAAATGASVRRAGLAINWALRPASHFSAGFPLSLPPVMAL